MAQAHSSDGAAALAVFGRAELPKAASAATAPKRATRSARYKNQLHRLRSENEELRARLVDAIAALQRATDHD
jgi:hypothetical protein